MDIIIGSAASGADGAKQVLVAAGYKPEEIALEFFRNQWFVAYTPTPYYALSPFIDEREGMFVLGDPLVKECLDVSQDDKSKFPSNWRTKKLLELWKTGKKSGAIQPFHPAALLWVDSRSGIVNFVTDAWSAVEFYYHYYGEEVFLSSSPDLLARLCKTSVDKISVSEYLSSHQISYPNTLYEGIYQVPPGSAGHFSRNELEYAHWWKPPAQDDGLSVDKAGTTLQREILDCLDRIRKQVGRDGTIAFSSGMDSRYLAVLGKRCANLNLKAVHTAATYTPDTLATSLLARSIGIPMKIHFRQRDHRELAYKKGLWGTGTQSPWRSAHSHSMGLGRREDKFVLDGYMADTILVMGDPFYSLRRKARGGLSAPYWDVSGFSRKLSDEVREAINLRWKYAREAFNLNEVVNCNLTDVYPSSRQEHKAHFNSARRSYPMYCPFMANSVLSLGFRLPVTVREITPKKDFYFSTMNDMRCVRKAERAKAILELITVGVKYIFPKFMRPTMIEVSGSWDSLKGGYHKQFKKDLERARLNVADFLSVDSVPKNRGIPLEIDRSIEWIGE